MDGESREIRVSASAVHALLAGVISLKEFSGSLFGNGQRHADSTHNPFTYMLKERMSIKEILVEDTAYDHSYLLFRFEGPDPALSPFVNPQDRESTCDT